MTSNELSNKSSNTIFIEEKKVSCYEAEYVMEKALDVGEAMLRSGAEILRVEDTIMRICLAYGGGIVDVFTILSLIIVSWHTTDNKNYTQTRRIYSYSTDLQKLEDLNSLSRYICANKPPCEEIEQRVEQIMYQDQKRIYKSELAGYVLGSGGFAVFFGGNLRDGLAAGIVACLIYFWNYHFAGKSSNRVVYTFICSFVACVMCLLSVYLGIGVNSDKVMIGTIMLLIPGINMMNSLRDMICGDIITGMLRLAEALMIAIAIAVGFGLAILFVSNVHQFFLTLLS